MKTKFLAAAIIAFGSLAGGGRAAVVSGTLLTIDADEDGFDDSTIDRVTFTVTAGTTVTFDILAWENSSDLNGDGELTRSDIQINLYNSSNLLILNNDDGPLGSDGSVSTLDSYMTATNLAAGTYFLTIGDLFYDQSEGLNGESIDDPGTWYSQSSPYETDHADWQLTLTASGGSLSVIAVSTVPEPSSAVLLGLGALGFATRRRRAA